LASPAPQGVRYFRYACQKVTGMRNIFLAVGAAVALYGAGLNGAVGQSSKDDENRWMAIENASEFEAWYVYAIPHKAEECCWSRDLLGSKTVIGKGETYLVNFDDGRKECVFDIRVVTNSRQGYEWNFDEINVCTASKVTLSEPDSSKRRRVKVKNDLKARAYYIYSIHKGKECCWSRDLLGRKTIGEGATEDVDFADGSKECWFDIRVTDKEARNVWTFLDQNVCDRDENNPIVLK
jgi:hypothetical protein